MNLKISIVTPSFNSGDFIEDAIRSVLSQEYPDFEHIIVDGGSHDGTLDILRRYPHLRWISEPDEGQSDALNKGFAMTTGDIIGWLNADETYTEGTFQKVSQILEDKSIDAIYSNFLFVNEQGVLIREVRSHRPVRWLSLFHCYIPSVTFFFKRKILAAGICIDKSIEISMDKEFFSHLLYSGYTFRYIDDCFAKFRWHANNKSLDTPSVRRIRYREGLAIFNRYSRIKFPANGFSILLYRLSTIVLLLFRKWLKYAG